MSSKSLKVVGFAAAGIVAIALLLSPPPDSPEPPGMRVSERTIAPELVVHWMLSKERPVRLVDVRSETDFLKNGIRGAVSLPADAISAERVLALPAGHTLVVYGASDDDGIPAFEQLGTFRDDILLLSGGYMAWEERVLEPEQPAADAPVEAWDTFAEQVAVSNYLLGKSDTAPLPERSVVAPVLRPRSQLSNEGC